MKIIFFQHQVDSDDSKESIGSKRSRFRESVFAVLKRLQGASTKDDLRPKKEATTKAASKDDNINDVDENDAFEDPTILKNETKDDVVEKVTYTLCEDSFSIQLEPYIWTRKCHESRMYSRIRMDP